MRSRRALREGAAICREALEPRPAVSRGEDVVVRYVSAAISIQGKAVAQADAEIGQSVYVMNPTNRDPFRAVVSAMREVVVHE
jgi:flagella basal body P-ring formation protein FlgA